MDSLRVVCVGGGLGAPTVMAGLRAYTSDITGLIAVTDSGRSTGKVRIALNVPAPGDLRSALTVLAEGDPALVRLFSHRFETEKSEELNGMAFGNLFLAALTQQEGSFLRAVEEASRLLRIRGRVLPVTLYNTHLCAKLADGSVVEEEVNVRATGKAPIERIYLKDDDVRATDGSVEAIAAADLITLGPGSLFTTVCACLLVPQIARAIADAQGLVVYVANTTTQPGQTDGFSIADHVRVVSDNLGGSGLDIVLVNDDPPPDHLRAHYAERGVSYLEPMAAELAKVEDLGVRAVAAPVIDKWSGPRDLWLKQDTLALLLEQSASLKARPSSGGLAGRTVALIFEKPSLRTRLSFDVGIAQLGGHCVYLSPAEVGLGRRESVSDVARVTSRMADAVVLRVNAHETIEEFARYSEVPVINGLSDLSHPCQGLADIFTIRERKGPDLRGVAIAYIGDGNNVAHSLMLCVAKTGGSPRLA